MAHSVQRDSRSRCYLCSSEKDLTREHIPPRGLFLKPRPANLITVPCCGRCNNSHSKDDELLRLIVSGGINKNPLGHRLWKEKILPQTIKGHRLPHEIRDIVRNTKWVTLLTPFGAKKVPQMELPQENTIPSLIRITKGLLLHHYPDMEYHDLQYRVQQIPQFKLNILIPLMTNNMFYDCRGDGVFRFWRGMAVDAPRCGMWVLLFFDSCGFTVTHFTNENRLETEQPNVNGCSQSACLLGGAGSGLY